MNSDAYTKVSAEKFNAYRGEKMASGETFYVRNDEDRPVSNKGRALADRLIEVLREEGLLDQIAKGGLSAALALDHLAEATVTVTDEALPQYARTAVRSYEMAVTKYAKDALSWSVGATHSSENVLARRNAETADDFKP